MEEEAMAGKVYIETFEDGPGGWLGWDLNGRDAQRLEIKDGFAISRSPWSVDYNHPPPEGGYLHILFCLHTKWGPGFRKQYKELGGPNRFVQGSLPRDFTNAKVTVRLKGNLKRKGADLLFHVQADVEDVRVNHVLVGQPLEVTPDWSEQTITLVPDPKQWRDLYARHDRRDFYGRGKHIADVLRDVNVDIIFVLFPLDVVPIGPLDGDPLLLRAGKDYPVEQSRLPEGYVMLDEVRMEFVGG